MSLDVELPARSARLFAWFRWYSERYLQKNFHAVRLAKASPVLPAHGPLLVVLNHPSWWDGMVGFPLLAKIPAAVHYAAIDAVAVQKYDFLKKLGFFGVDTNSYRGAADFLRVGSAILSAPNHAFWVTAQGQFTDPRVRPLRLRSGVGHLAARMTTGYVLPVAVEYPFWGERTPEALLRFGETLPVAEPPARSGKEWTALIEAALTKAMDDLAGDAMSRDVTRFDILLGGSAGVGGVYDLWRRARSWALGRRFDPSHTGEM